MLKLSVALESVNPFNTFPCSADRGTVVPPVVKSSTTLVVSTLAKISVTLVSVNPFNTFPCSADRGTVVPPVVKSSTILVSFYSC